VKDIESNKGTIGRRTFIKDMGIMGSAGLALASVPILKSCTPASSSVSGEKAKIAIIGTGSRGQYHIHNLIQSGNAEIIALCDNFEPHLKTAAQLCPDVKVFSDYRRVLDLPEVQGVLIATPLHEHARITIDSLRAGMHVFCEKSMALTLGDCLDMYNVYKESGKVLYIGQQRLFDPKYIKAMELIHSGVIGDVTGIRAYWFRNNDWRRPVPDKSLERKINWRLYNEFSGGLMTELATHQLQVANWALKMIPETVMGFGDIIYWKDGREVYDNVNLIYRYSNGVKLTYESNISNKFNGLEEQILGCKGTMEPEKNKYFAEEVKPAPGILQLVNNIEHQIFDKINVAGASWVPETASVNNGENILSKMKTTDGASSVGAVGDGSEQLVAAFCESVLTGKTAVNLVEEAYYSSVLALLGLQAMKEQTVVTFPEKYKIPYLNFA
jgi:predicted dehydrogenase